MDPDKIVRIALPRGEWSVPTEVYLRSMGLDISMRDGPMTRAYCGMQLRMVRAGDVPRLVESGYRYGITGSDLLEEAALRNMKLNVLDVFDGKDKSGRLVMYARNKCVPEDAVVVTRRDYENLARCLLKNYLKNGRLETVDGSDEGYVSSGEADAGFGLSVTGSTLKLEGLRIIEDFGAVNPVLIGCSGTSREELAALIGGICVGF